MTIFRYRFVALMTLLASGCDGLGSSGDDRICSTPSQLNVADAAKATKSWEQIGLTEDCVHRWAYRLAKSQGGNREIAGAVIGACRDAVLREGNLMFEENTGTKPDGNEEAVMFDELRKRYDQIALFRVVQARAGKCEPI